MSFYRALLFLCDLIQVLSMTDWAHSVLLSSLDALPPPPLLIFSFLLIETSKTNGCHTVLGNDISAATGFTEVLALASEL